MSEVGIDFGLGQQRVMPVRTAHRDEEAQPVVVEPRTREAVHLPVSRVGRAGSRQVELRERTRAVTSRNVAPGRRPVRTHMRIRKANSAAHAMLQETYALQMRQYHRGTAVVVVEGRDNPFHEPLS
jgi:hypothetical protein